MYSVYIYALALLDLKNRALTSWEDAYLFMIIAGEPAVIDNLESC